MSLANAVLSSADKAAGATQVVGVDSTGALKMDPAKAAAFQASVARARRDETRICLVGCSYEYMNGLQELAGNIFSYHQNSYISWANIPLGGILRVDNFGIGGQTNAQVCARVPASLAASNAKYVLIGGGIENDVQAVGAGTQAAAVTQALSDFELLRTEYLRVLSDASRVLITRTGAPRYSTGVNVTAAQRTYLATINTLVRAWSANNGVICFDLAAVLTNPSTGNAYAAGEYGWGDASIKTDDLTHMTFTGACNAGKELARVLQSIMPGTARGFSSYPEDVYNATTAPYGQLIANGKLLGTGGNLNSKPATGQLATGWTVNSAVLGTSGAIALSKVSDNRPDLRGEFQQIAMTGSTANTLQLFQSGAMPAGLIGKNLLIQAEISCDSVGWGGASGNVGTVPSITLDMYTSTWSLIKTFSINSLSSGNATSLCPDGVLFMDGCTVPSNAANWIFSLRATGIGTMRFGNIQCRPYY